MEGFRQLKDGKEFDSLADAAQCRSEADWLVGINATRGYSVRFGGYKNLLSIGRVQTPTLAILVQREEEISNFKPQPYWELIATFTHENGLCQGKWQKGEEDRFQTAESAKAILELITGKEGKIKKAEKKERKQPAPFLYDLTELQREANKKFGFSAEKTLKVAQSLYETHKVLTYPRTSSRFLSTDMASQLKTMLMAVNQEPYKSFVEELVVLSKLPVSNRIINDKKVTDHHAIVPTTKRANLGKLSADERKIYDLVVKRFLAVFYPNALWQHTTILTVVEGEEFITKGKILVEAGWRKVYGAEVVEEEDEQDAVLPPVNKGDQVKVQEGEVLEKLTKAPNRYTEAGLLSAMEGAGRFVEDEELREQIKEKGLGTPATRAQIIETLIKRNYVERKKKNLVPTEKGMELIRFIATKELISPELTAFWEQKLGQMEQGQYPRDTFMKEIKAFTQQVIEDIGRNSKAQPSTSQMGQATMARRATRTGTSGAREALGVCPLCKSGQIVENSKGFGCENWRADRGGCKFVIWKNKFCGKDIDENMIRQILREGYTEPIEGLTSNNGKVFTARLRLIPGSTGKLAMDFSKDK